MDKTGPTVAELVVEGFGDGGFRAEHALALAMADASPQLLRACKAAMAFLGTLPSSSERDALISQLNDAANAASTPATRNAS